MKTLAPLKAVTPSVLFAAFLTVSSGALAAAATPPAGKCVAYSNADLTGQSVTLQADTYDGEVFQPAFTPKSIFLADGAAARIYADAKFQGEVQVIGGAADLAGDLAAKHIRTTAGGHYLNLAEVWPGADVRSYSCVAAGTLVTLPAGSLAKSIISYGDKVFSITQFMNRHGNVYAITIDSPLVTVRSVQQDSGYGTQAVLDLVSGDITVTSVERGQPNPATSIVAKRPAAPSYRRLDLAYLGAVKLLLQPVTASAFNNLTASAQLSFFPEANPELNEILNLLSNYNFSL